jgi:FKBP-type peptidyl-prolyl cis-trans isomerase
MTTEQQTPINCTEDGKVTKIILKEGEGAATPTDDQEVDVTYIGTLEDGTEFDRGTDLENPFQFFVGTDEIIKGWSHGVRTMKKGETAKFTIGAEYAYGVEGRAPKIAPNATLIFEIALIDFR